MKINVVYLSTVFRIKKPNIYLNAGLKNPQKSFLHKVVYILFVGKLRNLFCFVFNSANVVSIVIFCLCCILHNIRQVHDLYALDNFYIHTPRTHATAQQQQLKERTAGDKSVHQLS